MVCGLIRFGCCNIFGACGFRVFVGWGSASCACCFGCLWLFDCIFAFWVLNLWVLVFIAGLCPLGFGFGFQGFALGLVFVVL